MYLSDLSCIWTTRYASVILYCCCFYVQTFIRQARYVSRHTAMYPDIQTFIFHFCVKFLPFFNALCGHACAFFLPKALFLPLSRLTVPSSHRTNTTLSSPPVFYAVSIFFSHVSCVVSLVSCVLSVLCAFVCFVCLCSVSS